MDGTKLTDMQVQAEAVEGLFRGNGSPVQFKAGERPIHLARLRFQHFQDHIGEELLGKIQAGGKFDPDGMHTAAGRLFQPGPELAAGRLGDLEELGGGELFLFIRGFPEKRVA